MKEKILEVLLHAKKKNLGEKELFDMFELDISSLVEELLNEGLIYKEKNRYYLVNHSQFVKGRLVVKAQGYGFLLSEDDRGDCYIQASSMNGAFQNDICIARSNTVGFGKRDGEIVKILKRGTSFIVGDFIEKKGMYYIVNDNIKENFLVVVPKNLTLGAMNNHKVKAVIKEYVDSNLVIAEVVAILGHRNDPGMDILSVIFRYNIPTGFSDEVISEVGNIPDYVLEEEIAGRKDLRDQNIITIDGDDTKDIDDAIYLYKKPNGNYHLGVHIADVSYYVKKKTKTDEEAYLRGTSVYLVDRVVPMLPHRLSNGICSLNPNVDRLAMSCEMEIDDQGHVVNERIFPSVIRSRAQMTYKNVNKILEGDLETIREYESFVQMFRDMNDLRKILARKRYKRGCIEFETTESKIYCDDFGKAIDVCLVERGKSERIIEEFMIVANETVAKRMSKFPFIYRIHEKPDVDKLGKMVEVVKNLGFPVKESPKNINEKFIQKFLNSIEGEKEERAINTLLLRSMMKAKYSEENVGHFGLASEYYTHFTSPIRRYPDLIVHRLIREFLFDKKTSENNKTNIYKQLINDSLHLSYREKEAAECERECDNMKKAEYMESHVGEVYQGMITSILAFGMFVELPNTVEGLIGVYTLDEYYDYDEDKMMLIGEHTKKIFKIGDIVKVKVTRACKQTQEIDFELVKTNENRKGRSRR